MNGDRLRELLDVCRDRMQRDDSELRAAIVAAESDPGMQAYFESSLQFDHAVLKRLQQQEVPEGVEQRILSVLATAARAGSDEGVESPSVGTTVDSGPIEILRVGQASNTEERQITQQAEVQRTATFGWSKRLRMIGWGAGALAATVLVALALSGQLWGTLDHSELITMARTWPDKIDFDSWDTSLADTPADYPMANGLHALPVGWQPCDTRLDSGGLVYRLVTVRSRQEALLFVATGAVRGLPLAPRAQPDSTTGNRCVGAWQANRCVYVLIVNGSTSDYRRFVDVSVAGARPGLECFSRASRMLKYREVTGSLGALAARD